MYGPIAAYKSLEHNDAKHWNRFVMGPWFHGGWSRPGGDQLGSIKFGSNTSDYYRENIQRPWFAYYLHDKGDGRFPEAWIFESGENAWHTFDQWPPKDAVASRLYLRENGRLSFDAPAAAVALFDEYVSDPRHPVPYMPRPIDGSRWREWLVQDQRFVQNRPDVLSWETEPLTDDVVIAGDVTANLFATTTGSDADWIVKLIDVYPDTVKDDPRMGGYELMVNADILRGRYYKGFSKATPIPPRTVTAFRSNLQQQLYRFKRGHRIMVQIQSTWFPLYDRNPQTFVPNIFEAKASDFKAQTHRIWRTAKYPSHIAVGVLRP
jgi:putative CocE/NonD family hydrolase